MLLNPASMICSMMLLLFSMFAFSMSLIFPLNTIVLIPPLE